METSVIRQKLHQFIDTGDQKLLKLMYALASEYWQNAEGDVSSEFSENDIARYETRRTNRLNGLSKTYDWDKAKRKITGK
ncbi:MAG: hypothetical protein QM640_06520 [Niabella sp.]